LGGGAACRPYLIKTLARSSKRRRTRKRFGLRWLATALEQRFA